MSLNLIRRSMRPNSPATGAPRSPAATDASALRSVHPCVAPPPVSFITIPPTSMLKLGDPSMKLSAVNAAASIFRPQKRKSLGLLPLKRSRNVERHQCGHERQSQAREDKENGPSNGRVARRQAPNDLHMRLKSSIIAPQCRRTEVHDAAPRRDFPWIHIHSRRTICIVHLAARRREARIKAEIERKLSKGWAIQHEACASGAGCEFSNAYVSLKEREA